MKNSMIPKVAIIYGEGSASPLTIKASSVGLCEIIFLYTDCNKRDMSQLNLLKNHAKIFDITFLTDDEVVMLLHEEKVDAVLTFSESQLSKTTRYCTKLNLIGHSIETVTALTDKYLQRELLSKFNVNSVKHAIVNRDCAIEAAEKVGFPAVLKPRVGAGSKWTGKIHSLQELQTALIKGPPHYEYVLEEFLEGDDCFKDTFYGDYVSVESVHQEGVSQQICVTAKLPLTEHFAETGMFLPHPFSPELVEKITELESGAIKALGVLDGITHTEIKITADGPKIIEVNGRLGGYVPEIVKRSMGINLVRTALEVSLGIKADIKPNSSSSSVDFQVFLTAPYNTDMVFDGIDGAKEVENIDGVLHVEITKDIGEIVDYRQGTQSNLGIVYGTSPNFEAFLRTINDIRTTIIPKISIKGEE
ncbi:ATP-grasp domain-containing protein [Bacillus pseudomycoides]|uniref:ATP-grasp domain-containing protein n=1 Tax=Bacillus pseudomycoides TaxID=64104 RepID=UPI0015D4CC87|nr:ATP-grasp domain-containing protein [Bacillus pseudomycoides]